ncbi:hypothetical protein PIB30_073089 [Stylosanthes scabra]|uniref:F-box protein n=1 Tax=Stylosanthes scabra TaxID=79078 RepID=A0ABU6XQR8_9FABA|nr:hypothetical protein [Stylosanthes scabra]
MKAAGIFPPGPTLLHDCYVANLQGEVYLLANDALDFREKEMMGFWVLRCSSSGSKKWHPLSLPPALLRRDDSWDCFVWRDKLFLEAYDNAQEGIFQENIIFYVYDPQTDDSWKQLEIPFSYSDSSRHHPPSIMPVLSLGDVGNNCSVAMTWSTGKDRASRHDLKIHALLVDNEEYCVRGNQCLDEVCEAIIPSSFDFHGDRNVNFVDLGKGKVCVLIGGITKDKPVTRNELLCVLVLQLCLQQEEGHRFLSVEVLVNQVYDMLPYETDCLELPYSSFLFSLNSTQTSLIPR